MHYRWTRRATVAGTGNAREFAAMVTDYVNERHGLSVSWGVEINGDANIYWYADYESLASFEQALAGLMGDSEYWEKVVTQAEGIFLPGSVHDSMVAVM